MLMTAILAVNHQSADTFHIHLKVQHLPRGGLIHVMYIWFISGHKGPPNNHWKVTVTPLVEHFTFLSEKIDKKCRSIYSHFSPKKEVKNLKHFHHFFDLKSKWKMWNKFCDVVKMFLLHFLTELKVKMMVKKSKVFSLIFSAEIKVKNVKQSWSYC